MRLDVYIAQQHGFSRTHAQRLITERHVTLNGKVQRASTLVKSTDVILCHIPELKKTPLIAQAIPLDIVYEDDDFLAVNKSAGMVVHPACGHWDGTLVNALLSHCGKLSNVGGVERPGIVHRLDKDTSGLVLVAKNDLAHQQLAKQFQNRTLTKKYRAMVEGNVKNDDGEIIQSLGRNPHDRKKVIVTTKTEYHPRQAISSYHVLKRYQSVTLLDVSIATGRTHQIRVHLAFIGHPVLGDPLYGHGNVSHPNMRLQAYFLSFLHPRSKAPITLEIPPVFS